MVVFVKSEFAGYRMTTEWWNISLVVVDVILLINSLVEDSSKIL